jgi:hypothetical protein
VTTSMDRTAPPATPPLGRIRAGTIGQGEAGDGPDGPRRVTHVEHTASARPLDAVEDVICAQVLPRHACAHTESSGKATTAWADQTVAALDGLDPSQPSPRKRKDPR